MTAMRGLATVLASGAVLGALGAGIGWALASLAPEYYAVVFHRPNDGTWNITRFGLGLGLLQGTGLGIGVGLVLTAIQAWYDLRLRQSASN